jgi:hypothetical protein
VRDLTRADVTDTVAMKVTGHKTHSAFDRYDITGQFQGQSTLQRTTCPIAFP